LSNTIIVGSLALHILFGGVMGFWSRLAVIWSIAKFLLLMTLY
jgi:hypothetical protein